jgi:hypothetical protein
MFVHTGECRLPWRPGSRELRNCGKGRQDSRWKGRFRVIFDVLKKIHHKPLLEAPAMTHRNEVP